MLEEDDGGYQICPACGAHFAVYVPMAHSVEEQTTPAYCPACGFYIDAWEMEDDEQ